MSNPVDLDRSGVFRENSSIVKNTQPKIDFSNPPVARIMGVEYILSEKEDSENAPLADYRKDAVEEITHNLEMTDAVHLDAVSGSGVTEFIIPQLTELLVQRGNGVLVLPGGPSGRGESDKYILEDIAEKGNTKTVLIVDEPADSDAYAERPVEWANRLIYIQKQTNTKVVFCVGETDETRDRLTEIKSRLSDTQVPQVTVRPKPFNQQQSAEYFMRKVQDSKYRMKEASRADIISLQEAFYRHLPPKYPRLFKIDRFLADKAVELFNKYGSFNQIPEEEIISKMILDLKDYI